MYEVLMVVYLIIALAIIGLVLIQQGKGADMGASFGSGGGSGTLFGSSGAGNFLTRSTGVLATIFFIVSLVLGNLTAERANQTSEFENLEAPAVEQTDVPASIQVPAKKDSEVPN